MHFMNAPYFFDKENQPCTLAQHDYNDETLCMNDERKLFGKELKKVEMKSVLKVFFLILRRYINLAKLR